MNAFVTAVLVALGGSIGAVARTLVSHLAIGAGLEAWIATLGVNVTGCFAMGWVFVVLEARFRASGSSALETSPHFHRLRDKGWQLGDDPTLPTVDLFRADQNLRFLSGLLMTGALGSFTTFSAFSLETVMLLRDGHLAVASGNCVLSIGLSLSAVALGLHVGQRRVPKR